MKNASPLLSAAMNRNKHDAGSCPKGAYHLTGEIRRARRQSLQGFIR